MKRLSLAIIALAMVVVLIISGMRFSYHEPTPTEIVPAVTVPLASPIPTPVATVIPTEDVQSSPRILSQLKDVATVASRNIEFTVQAENAIAYSWIFTSPSTYDKGRDITVFAEELTATLPARGFTVSGTNSSTLKLTHVPYSLNGWTLQVQCFGKNGATATSFPATITVAQPPAVTNPPVIVAPTPVPAAEPTAEPSVEPTAEPSAEPSAEPVAEPSPEPSVEPSTEPSAEPSVDPPAEPSAEPGVEPSAEPITEPTAEPIVEPAPPPTETEAPVVTEPTSHIEVPTPAEVSSTPTEKQPSGDGSPEMQAEKSKTADPT